MALPKELSVDSSPTPDWLRHSELLNAALGYAALGWRVFPIRCPVFTAFGVRCSCNKKDCRNPGKHSHILKFQSAASTNHTAIEGWWKEWPDANIGIVTGRTSRIVVLDVDPRNDGDESLGKLTQLHGALPETVTAVTSGGGSLDRDAYPGLDIQADKVCVVAPPSRHKTGEKYRWVEGLEPHCTEMAPLPSWILREITGASKKRPRNRTKTGELAKSESVVTKGGRNIYLISFAGAVSTYCTTQTELEDYVSIHNETHCKPPLPKSEVENVANSAARYENGQLQDLIFEIWSPNELDKLEKAILWTLVRYCNWSTWQCWPSRETIKKSAGVSLKSTDRTLKSLSSRGLISWERCPFQSNLYTVHVDKVRSITSGESSPNPPIPPCLDTGSQRPLEETNSCPPDT